MANTMRILKKVETPRPLKSSTTSQLLAIKLPQDTNQVTADSLISIAESIANSLVTKSSDVGLQNNLIWLSHQLKVHGPRIEVNYRDSLNKIFVIFRNASQNEDTNYNIRLTLLQLIELRANNWQTSDGANSYYKTKVSHIQEAVPLDPLILSTSPEPFANTITPTQLLLGPGEVVRASGKYARPTKIPGKNYSKDEVVIRNADSGKVNPGAKERLVQITGPTEEKINHAKQLIEDTIRRNASPVRTLDSLSLMSVSGAGECDGDSVDSMGSMTFDDALLHRGLHHSRSVNDASVEEYKYTVSVGDDVIKITGNSLHYVTAAKLELDRFFSSTNFKTLEKTDSTEDALKNISPVFAPSEDIAVGYGNGFDPTREAFTPEEQSPMPCVERRKFFSRKSSEIRELPELNAVYKYSMKCLTNCAKSPYSDMEPRDMETIRKNNIAKMKQVNVTDAIKRCHATNRADDKLDNRIFIRQYFSNTNLLKSSTKNNNHISSCGCKNNVICVRQLNGNINNNYH